MKEFQLYDVPYYDDFYAMVTGSARLYGSRPALVQYDRKGGASQWTYCQLQADVLALAESLCARGLAGAHIAVAGENSYQWIVAFLAIAVSGGVCVCIDIEQADEVIRQMIVQADCTAAFVSPSIRPLCMPLAQDGLRLIGLSGSDGGNGETLELLRAQGEALRTSGAPLHIPLSLDSEQTAAIIYTSGTTSNAKPVMLTQKGMLTNATEAVRLVDPGEVVFTSLPLYHAFGLNMAVLDVLILGRQVVLNGNLRTTMRDLGLAKPNTIASVPLILENLRHTLWAQVEKAGGRAETARQIKRNRLWKKLGFQPRLEPLHQAKEQAFGPLTWAVCGGAHVERALIDDLELFGITVLQGYGISECGPLISVNATGSNRPGSVGQVIPSCQIRFEEEEVLVRSRCVMKGYYKAPKLTADCFTDGWFHTGDLGYLDRDGFLFITGWKKNLIVFKNGKKLSPESLECQLNALPLVREVVVTGAVNGSATDDVKVAATICPDPEQTAGMSSYEILEALQREVDAINAKLPPYQQIQLINIRDTEFEKTSSKKIKRNAI